MPSKRLIPCAVLALPVVAASLCAPLRAAELGEIKVNSHIGQQLSADIELVDLTAADLADIQARLANPDVFKGAGLRVPPELGGLYISVARRDNRRFLHLTTLQPVQGDVLHLFLELNSGGRQVIRAASLWLTPEPAAQRQARSGGMPAAAPVPLTASAPVTLLAPAAPSSPPPQNAEAGLSEAAQRAFAHRKQVAQAQAAAAATAGPSSGPAPAAETMVPPASTATAAPPKSGAPATAAVAPAAGAAVAKPGPQARRVAASAGAPGSAVPAKKGPEPAPAAAPQSCAPAKEVEAQLQQCQAMTSKLADIEGKVTRLQKSLVAPAVVAAPAGAAAAKAAAATAAPAPAKPGATPVKPGVAADLAGGSSKRLAMIVGGALAGLAALGGAIFYLRRRQAKGRGPLQVWQSFRKKGKPEDDVPTLEDAVEVAAN